MDVSGESEIPESGPLDASEIRAVINESLQRHREEVSAVFRQQGQGLELSHSRVKGIAIVRTIASTLVSLGLARLDSRSPARWCWNRRNGGHHQMLDVVCNNCGWLICTCGACEENDACSARHLWGLRAGIIAEVYETARSGSSGA